MQRRSLLDQLEAYVPATSDDTAAVKRMRNFITHHPECFERTLNVGHVTASAWIVGKDRHNILLTHHAKLGMWLQMGGHCDGDSNVLAVARREASEESGLRSVTPVHATIFDVDVHQIPAYGEVPAHHHYDVRFLFEADESETLVPTSESKEIKWVHADELESLTQEPSMLRMRARAAKYFGY